MVLPVALASADNNLRKTHMPSQCALYSHYVGDMIFFPLSKIHSVQNWQVNKWDGELAVGRESPYCNCLESELDPVLKKKVVW